MNTLTEFFKTFMWINFAGHNIFGLTLFGIMIFVTYYRFVKLEISNPSPLETFSLRNVSLLVASACIASFFHHVTDLMSIPTLLYLYGVEYLAKINYVSNITLQQLVLAEAFVVYTYRDRINLKLFAKYLPIMVMYAFSTALVFGATSFRQLARFEDQALRYYVWHYIPTWVIFLITYLWLIKGEE